MLVEGCIVLKHTTNVFVIFSLYLCFSAMVLASNPVNSVPPSISLQFIKHSGFDAGTFEIQGTFAVVAVVSADVVRVEFYLDHQLVLNDTDAPFQWELDTADYELGQHVFEGIAFNDQGESMQTSVARIFVAGPPTWFLGIIAAIAVGSLLLVVVGSYYQLGNKRKSKKVEQE